MSSSSCQLFLLAALQEGANPNRKATGCVGRVSSLTSQPDAWDSCHACVCGNVDTLVTPSAVSHPPQGDVREHGGARRDRQHSQMMTCIRVLLDSKHQTKKTESVSMWEVTFPTVYHTAFSQISVFPTNHKHWLEAPPSPCLPAACLPVAKPAFFQLLGNPRLPPAPGPLHMILPLPGILLIAYSLSQPLFPCSVPHLSNFQLCSNITYFIGEKNLTITIPQLRIRFDLSIRHSLTLDTQHRMLTTATLLFTWLFD